MPIYEYECGACGFRKDFIQKMSDEPLTDCPECGKPALKKLVSAAAFRLKGGGWYETDFKTGDKKKNLHGDNKPASKTDSGTAASKSGDASSTTPKSGKS